MLKYREPTGALETVVTYHDPCHLREGMKAFRRAPADPRGHPRGPAQGDVEAGRLLRHWRHVLLTHYETGAEIAKKRMEDIDGKGADTIATGCPGCAMHLVDFSHRAGKNQPVKHYISLLAESYRKKKRGGT